MLTCGRIGIDAADIEAGEIIAHDSRVLEDDDSSIERSPARCVESLRICLYVSAAMDQIVLRREVANTTYGHQSGSFSQ